jgi:hypothetical protein
MGKHEDDKDGHKPDSDPSKWDKPKDDGGRHGKDQPKK